MKIVKITNEHRGCNNNWYKIGEYYIVRDNSYIPYIGSTVTIFKTVENDNNVEFILCEDCVVIEKDITHIDTAKNIIKHLLYIEKADEWKPVNGEMIMIREYESCDWEVRKFIGMDSERFVCKNSTGVFASWKYARKIEEPKEVVMTISEIEKKLGITNLKIVKE